MGAASAASFPSTVTGSLEVATGTHEEAVIAQKKIRFATLLQPCSTALFTACPTAAVLPYSSVQVSHLTWQKSFYCLATSYPDSHVPTTTPAMSAADPSYLLDNQEGGQSKGCKADTAHRRVGTLCSLPLFPLADRIG